MLKLQLIDYKCFGAYDRDVAQVLKEAKTYVEQRSARATPDEKLAIVLDIDETSISNWVNLSTDDFGFFQKGECTLQPKEPCGFDEWIAKQTPDPIRPTLDLFATAKAKDIKVFFISARREEQRADTVKNLIATGYKDWDDLILKQPNDPPSVSQFKTAARASHRDDGTRSSPTWGISRATSPAATPSGCSRYPIRFTSSLERIAPAARYSLCGDPR